MRRGSGHFSSRLSLSSMHQDSRSQKLDQWYRSVRLIVSVCILAFIWFAFVSEFELLEHQFNTYSMYRDEKAIRKHTATKDDSHTATNTKQKPHHTKEDKSSQENFRTSPKKEEKKSANAKKVRNEEQMKNVDRKSITQEVNKESSTRKEVIPSAGVSNNQRDFPSKPILQSFPEKHEGTPSTSIARYLETANYPHMITLLKWDSSGALERISPVDIPNWLPDEAMKMFERTQRSKHGTVAFLLNTDVMAAVPWDIIPPIPFLTYTVPKKCENEKRFQLLPNPYDRDHNFNRACIRHAEKITTKTALHDRKNVIIWRGIPHGISDPNRLQLIEMSKEDPNNEWLDAVNIEEDPSKHLERDEMSEYKYQLDIGGESGTTWGSLRWKMCSGNLVFKVDSWSKDWWHDTIGPWKHYIPVKDDLGDLREQYEWAESHPNEVSEIVERAVETCKATVTEAAVAEFQQNVMISIPSSSKSLVEEADAVLNGLGSFYQPILDKTK